MAKRPITNAIPVIEVRFGFRILHRTTMVGSVLETKFHNKLLQHFQTVHLARPPWTLWTRLGTLRMEVGTEEAVAETWLF